MPDNSISLIRPGSAAVDEGHVGPQDGVVETNPSKIDPRQVVRVDAPPSVATAVAEPPKLPDTPSRSNVGCLKDGSVVPNTHEQNVYIQAMLKDAGVYKGTIDGNFGTQSEKAYEEFLKNNQVGGADSHDHGAGSAGVKALVEAYAKKHPDVGAHGTLDNSLKHALHKQFTAEIDHAFGRERAAEAAHGHRAHPAQKSKINPC